TVGGGVGGGGRGGGGGGGARQRDRPLYLPPSLALPPISPLSWAGSPRRTQRRARRAKAMNSDSVIRCDSSSTSKSNFSGKPLSPKWGSVAIVLVVAATTFTHRFRRSAQLGDNCSTHADHCRANSNPASFCRRASRQASKARSTASAANPSGFGLLPSSCRSNCCHSS